MTLPLFYAVIFIGAALLTGLIRRYALATDLLDIPNDRSSHALPTPRGGGLSFVLCFMASMLMLGKQGVIPPGELYVFIGPCFIVAMLGFLDDRFHLSAVWRLAGHFMMAVLAIYLLRGFPVFFEMTPYVVSGYLLCVFVVFYLVWLLNLFNFMDGIDGLAAAESICVCAGGALLYYIHGQASLAVPPLLLAVAVGGFLIWNFPPARIFMGDVGSGFLGFVIGVFSLQAAMAHGTLFWGWVILAGVFITDATLTLIRRGLAGERVFEAHRSHAYQQAVQYAGKHWPVTVSVILINAAWLFPWALLVALERVSVITGITIAYAPLLLTAIKFNAGKKAEC
ncbi:MraY family glycosyltransferase [Legionella spiritensis]|uniref:MraY family glycosyltransferase n=1 Tax=Legionella spiritensis TaxID=452 RepID=UPI000F6DB5E0|nr:glycosyltransferase family 4 protein [Legionella spiritensis]VEG90370.1 alpha-N-acetylglucosaminyltransferase [Legionella spiritensis]